MYTFQNQWSEQEERGILQFSKIEKHQKIYKALVGIKQMFNRSPIPTVGRDPSQDFLAELQYHFFFFQRELISYHPSPTQILSSLPTCFSGYWFQLHFVTEILLLPRKKSKVKNNLVFLALLAQAPQSTLSTEMSALVWKPARMEASEYTFCSYNHPGAGRLMVLCWGVKGMNCNEITDVRDHLGESSITSLLLIFLNVSNWALAYNKLFLAEKILLVRKLKCIHF